MMIFRTSFSCSIFYFYFLTFLIWISIGQPSQCTIKYMNLVENLFSMDIVFLSCPKTKNMFKKVFDNFEHVRKSLVRISCNLVYGKLTFEIPKKEIFKVDNSLIFFFVVLQHQIVYDTHFTCKCSIVHKSGARFFLLLYKINIQENMFRLLARTRAESTSCSSCPHEVLPYPPMPNQYILSRVDGPKLIYMGLLNFVYMVNIILVSNFQRRYSNEITILIQEKGILLYKTRLMFLPQKRLFSRSFQVK